MASSPLSSFGTKITYGLAGFWSRVSSYLPWAKKKPAVATHTGGNGYVWRDLSEAPKAFRGAVLAAAKAMAYDDEVPVGLSMHTVNGTPVEVHKPAPGHLQVTRYASEN